MLAKFLRYFVIVLSTIPALTSFVFVTYIARAGIAFGHLPRCCDPDPWTFNHMLGDDFSLILVHEAHANLVHLFFIFSLISLILYLATIRVGRPQSLRWMYRLGWLVLVLLIWNFGVWFLD